MGCGTADEALEVMDGFLHAIGLGVEFLGGAGALLGAGGVGLGDRVHLADRACHLFDTLRLFG